MAENTNLPRPPVGRWSGGICVLIVTAYMLLAWAAVAFFRTPLAMPAGNELSLPRCVFTVANAASLSGFEMTIPVRSYEPLAQLVIFTLILLGSLVSMIVGGAAVARLLRLPYTLGQIALAAAALEAGAILIGGTILALAGRNVPQAIFQAASAFGNCGIVIGTPGALADLTLHAVILPLAVLGGLGLPVLMELLDSIRHRRAMSHHARIVLVMTAIVYLLGAAVLTLPRWPSAVPADSSLAQELRPVLIDASGTALNARTLGWPVESPGSWPRQVAWLVVILMLIGASPAGTGGGLKTTTVATLFAGTGSLLRGGAGSRMLGLALLWTGLYLLLVLVLTLRLLATDAHVPADQIVFLAVSAASNVGLSLAPLTLTADGTYAVSAVMMLGRLLPLGMLWFAAMTVRDADVAVG